MKIHLLTCRDCRCGVHPFQIILFNSDRAGRSCGLWTILTFSRPTVFWAACHFDFASAPVYVGVVFCKPSVSQNDCTLANTHDMKGGSVCVVFVANNKVNGFSNMACFIWSSIHIVDCKQVGEMIGPKFDQSDILNVNELS